MKQLLKLYLEKDLKREIMLLGIFAAGIGIIAVILRYQFNYAVGIRHIHTRMLQFWMVWNVGYTLLTAFAGFQNPRHGYSTMLLPASMNHKFLFTALRTFILLPFISLLILYLISKGFTTVMGISDGTGLQAASVWNCLMGSSYIMHRLPVIPFQLVLFTSVAMLLKTVRKRMLTVMIPLALIFSVLVFLYGPNHTDGDCNYPFIWALVEERMVSSFGTPYYTDMVSEVISWTSLSARMQRAVSYAYLLALPAALTELAYLRFKEMETEE